MAYGPTSSYSKIQAAVAANSNGLSLDPVAAAQSFFHADERISAGYIEDVIFFGNFRLMGGVRFDNGATHFLANQIAYDANGNPNISPIRQDASYFNALPTAALQRQVQKDTNLRAWTPQMAELYDVDLVAGRHMTETDLRTAAPVCVIGNDLVDNLLPGVDPIGKEIRWNNTPCQIIGLGKKEGSTLGTSLDNWIILPMTTYNKQNGNQQDSLRVTCRSGSAAKIQESVDEVRQIMRGRHHLAYAKKDDFAVETSDSFLALWKDISGTFFVVTIGVASISLVVGGIVIMNIMLVSVTERTREIGLRKAIGARRGDILMQFLIEALTIAAIGGALGVIFGVLLAKIVSWVSPLPSSVQLWSVLGGLLVALSVGLFFGTYPASKAAKLDPVDALRSE